MPYKIEGKLSSNHVDGPHYVFRNKKGWWVFHAKAHHPAWFPCTDDWGYHLYCIGRPVSWLEILVISGLTQTEAERMGNVQGR